MLKFTFFLGFKSRNSSLALNGSGYRRLFIRVHASGCHTSQCNRLRIRLSQGGGHGKIFCSDFFRSDFLLLNDAKELISYKCTKLSNLIATLLSNLLLHIVQKNKIASEEFLVILKYWKEVDSHCASGKNSLQLMELFSIHKTHLFKLPATIISGQ